MPFSTRITTIGSSFRSEGSSIRDEIGIYDIRRNHAAREVAFLMHANAAVNAVLDENYDDRQLVLKRRAEFVAAHLKVAVTGERHDGAARIHQLRRNGRGKAVAHRSADRRQLR